MSKRCEEFGRIDDAHRKELLRFLLVKTAAVRSGVKPGELLRVKHCYEQVNEQGLRFCLYRRDIYCTLRLDYVELKVEENSSLVLFYNPAVLAKTLEDPKNRAWLEAAGYPKGAAVADFLAELKSRAATCALPHEVGIFIGYPLKDVDGFVRQLPVTPGHRGLWRVYGQAGESLRRMREYLAAEIFAAAALDGTSDLEDFYVLTRQYKRSFLLMDEESRAFHDAVLELRTHFFKR